MKYKNKLLIVLFVFVLLFNIKSYATSFHNYYYFPNPSQNYNSYFNPYYQGSIYNIPANSYYYIAGYDRNTTKYYNGVPMISRVPIIAGSDYFSARIANGIIYNAYGAISTWCNNNVLTKEGIQDYYLNYARIVSQTSSTIALNVNCSFQRVGIISGYMEFRINVDIYNNRYTWHRLNADGSVYTDEPNRCDDDYEYEYDDGRIIIIK